MMNLLKIFAILLLMHCIICMSAPCFGAAEPPERKWTSYARDRDTGVEYFYDMEALLKPSKDLIQMWRKRVFPAGAAQKEIVTFDEIDCRKGRYRSLELSVTYRDGTAQRFDKVAPWADVYANTAEEYLMDEHCK
jgi:hypothetical protein